MEDVSDWKAKFEMLSKLPALDVIDIGGGMPISYDNGNFDTIIGIICDGVKRLKAKRVIAEPGRFIVGPACSLVTRVELVDNGNAVLNCSVYNVHIDTIIADLILPCRVLGKQSPSTEYKLLGSSLCNLDVFDKKAKLPKLSEGDVIVFDKAGAYSFSSDFGSGSVIKTYMVD
jgi:diaminopimelate decarboxylase